MLHFHNTLSGNKERFEPLKPGHIGIYICGVTVYDDCHIGHARTRVAFDVIVRYLRASGYQVRYVSNITDIDDKIITRANALGEPVDQLTARYIERMHEDFGALNILAPDIEPRATGTMPEMIALIENLIGKSLAYATPQGDVYFRVKRFSEYGKLSKQHLDDLYNNVRHEMAPNKEDTLDFALWKSAKPDEPSWPSPWGNGRPGWHIECSAMAIQHLGETFDIHGGGGDLMFPHHENEIAQSEGACERPFARYWLHTGMLFLDKEKMSKSLGNVLSIRSVLEKWDGETLRYFFLSANYRTRLAYSDEKLQASRAALERLYTALRGCVPDEVVPKNSEYLTRFYQAMDDDFNTPEALAVFFELARDINQSNDQHKKKEANALAALLIHLGGILGILQHDPNQFLQGRQTKGSIEEIEAFIAQRNQARRDKNWAQADRIRDLLLERDIELEDTSSGTIWRNRISQ